MCGVVVVEDRGELVCGFNVRLNMETLRLSFCGAFQVQAQARLSSIFVPKIYSMVKLCLAINFYVEALYFSNPNFKTSFHGGRSSKFGNHNKEVQVLIVNHSLI